MNPFTPGGAPVCSPSVKGWTANPHRESWASTAFTKATCSCSGRSSGQLDAAIGWSGARCLHCCQPVLNVAVESWPITIASGAPPLGYPSPRFTTLLSYLSAAPVANRRLKGQASCHPGSTELHSLSLPVPETLFPVTEKWQSQGLGPLASNTVCQVSNTLGT